jgi:hypothetical protein
MGNLPDNIYDLDMLQREIVKRIAGHASTLDILRKAVSDKESEAKELQELLGSIAKRRAQILGRPYRAEPTPAHMIDLQMVFDSVEKDGLTWAQLGRKLGVSTSRARSLYEKAGRMIRYGRPS